MIVTVATAGVLAAGCKTIVRENIISSIDTGVGATIAENKQTQMYELKAGYIRSQFYSIPTGKLVENKGATDGSVLVTSPDGTVSQKGQISNAANVTPQMVSGIRAHSGLGDLVLGMDISENFAVGKDAVNSPAAVAMYFSQITNSAVAQAAANASQSASAATLPGATPGQIALIGQMSSKISAMKNATSPDIAGATAILRTLNITPKPGDDVFDLLHKQVQAAAVDHSKLPPLQEAFGF